MSDQDEPIDPEIQGVEDYRYRGLDLEDNPYDEGHNYEAWKAWRKGWKKGIESRFSSSVEVYNYARAMYWSHELRLGAEDPWDFEEMPDEVKKRWLEKAKKHLRGRQNEF